MFRTLIQAFTSPVAGPVGFALAVAMCVMLVVTVVSAERNEAQMQAHITALTAENQRNGVALHARLAACEGGPADLARARATSASLSVDERAQKLTGEPAGFDVCARMESADRAVLETLR
jgi:Tfp pilus assembly protein PilX